jgi:hypothetical protein
MVRGLASFLTAKQHRTGALPRQQFRNHGIPYVALTCTMFAAIGF